MPGLLTIKNIIIMKNLKYLPYAAFLVLAAVSYSCSDDDGGNGSGGGPSTSGSGMPTTAELGVEWPMSRVVDYDTEYLRLDYDADGRLTGGYDFMFGGNFTVDSMPLSFEYYDRTESYDDRCVIDDIKVNEAGYIVSASISESFEDFDTPVESWDMAGAVEVAYNADGRMTEVVERCTFEENGYVGTAVCHNTYTWQGGQIATQVYRYEESFTENGQTYTYGEEEHTEFFYDGGYDNTGVYAELDDIEIVYSSLLYSGLLGKAPTQLPSSYITTEYYNGQPEEQPSEVSRDATYDSDGRVMTYAHYTFYYHDAGSAPVGGNSKAYNPDHKRGAKAVVERMRSHRAARH